MLLSILIPTYNRASFLLKNLSLLCEYIQLGGFENEVEIIISNNASTDDTDDRVSSFILENTGVQLNYFRQESNIGLKKNALFVLDSSTAEFVMYLGDDDFLEFNFLKKVLETLKSGRILSSIIPNYVPVNINGEVIGKSRDEGLESKYFAGGVENCLINSWRGHQLSGLVLRREGLSEAYCRYQVDNVYLFIFLLSYSCLQGDTYHLTQFPVQVTQPGQEKKDWGYGKDGLMNEVFDNYYKLPISFIYKTQLQIKFFKQQNWRLWNYQRNGSKAFMQAFIRIWFSKNASFGFQLVFPFLVLKQSLGRIVR